MQVTREDGVDTRLHQLPGYVVVVLDDIVGKQLVLLVEVLHQVMVHHGDDALAFSVGLAGYLGDPLQRFGLDAPAVVIGVGAVATAGEQVQLVHIAIDTDDDHPLDRFAAVAERCRVALEALPVAVVAVHLGELLTGNRCSG